MSGTLVCVVCSAPPFVSDFREGLECARSLGCPRVAFLPLGVEYVHRVLSPLARHVATLLSVMDTAPTLLMLGNKAKPSVLLPLPTFVELSTVSALACLTPESVSHVYLGRGVTEWLVSAAPSGTAQSWRALLSGVQGCILGDSTCEGDAREALVSSLLSCPILSLRSVGLSRGMTPAAGIVYSPLTGVENDFLLVPPSVRGFLRRQRLWGEQPWWTSLGIPDAWRSSSSSTGGPAPLTLPPAPTLEPTPPPLEEPPVSLPVRRVALLGGSFNPPTLAHTLLAEQVLRSGDFTEVWLVPCGPRADKSSVVISPLQRTVLTALALEGALSGDGEGILTLPLELFEGGALATADLLARLESCVEARGVAAGVAITFSLVIGADALPSLHSWRHPQRLMANARFCVCPRPGYTMSEREGPGSTVQWPKLAVKLGEGVHKREGSVRVEAVLLSSSECRGRVRAAATGVEEGERDPPPAGARVCGALDGLTSLYVSLYVATQGLYLP